MPVGSSALFPSQAIVSFYTQTHVAATDLERGCGKTPVECHPERSEGSRDTGAGCFPSFSPGLRRQDEGMTAETPLSTPSWKGGRGIRVSCDQDPSLHSTRRCRCTLTPSVTILLSPLQILRADKAAAMERLPRNGSPGQHRLQPPQLVSEKCDWLYQSYTMLVSTVHSAVAASQTTGVKTLFALLLCDL